MKDVDTEMPGWDAYCELLAEATAGEETHCDGVFSCAECSVFWEQVEREGLEIYWICPWCMAKEKWEALGYFSVGEGALWSEETSDVYCDDCGKTSLVLTAAVERNAE